MGWIWLTKEHRNKPFVGYAGSRHTLTLDRSVDGWILRTSTSTQWILRLGMVLFGPGLTALLVWLWPRAERGETPWFILAVVGFFTIIAWRMLFRSVVYPHRAELCRSARSLSLYRTRDGSPVATLRPDDVTQLGRTIARYRADDGPTVANQVLQLINSRGEIVALCASPDASWIDALERELTETLNAPRLEPAPNDSL